MSRTLVVALLLGLALARCNCGGTKPPNGIYQATYTTLTDTCTPQACDGDGGEVPVLSNPDGSVRVPVTACFKGQSVQFVGTYYRDVPGDYAIRGACGAVIGHQTLTLESISPQPIVRSTIDLDAGECPDAGFTGYWPYSPCSIDQRFTYELVTDCQPPCSNKNVPGTPWNCVCP